MLTQRLTTSSSLTTHIPLVGLSGRLAVALSYLHPLESVQPQFLLNWAMLLVHHKPMISNSKLETTDRSSLTHTKTANNKYEWRTNTGKCVHDQSTCRGGHCNAWIPRNDTQTAHASTSSQSPTEADDGTGEYLH